MIFFQLFYCYLNKLCNCPDPTQEKNWLPQVLVERAPSQDCHRLLNVQGDDLFGVGRSVGVRAQDAVAGVVDKVVARQRKLQQKQD